MYEKITIPLLLLLCISFAKAQGVKNTSYETPGGEKVLGLEMIVPFDKKKAWDYFTKDELLQKWIAPLVHIELKTGGYILANNYEAKSLEDSSAIRLAIINYLPGELLTLKVKLNNNFPKPVQDEVANLQELIQFKDAGKGKTKIISSRIGWVTGDDWDKSYSFFVKGNIWTYEEF